MVKLNLIKNMDQNWFKNNIQLDWQTYKSSLYSRNSDLISDELQKGSQSLITEPINSTSIEKGMMYFIFYDLQGKTSNLEKWNPILAVDWYDDGQTRQLIGLSANFIPVAVRAILFNSLCGPNTKIFQMNQELPTSKQSGIDNITFGKIHMLLKSIGFEWALRKFDIRKINKCWQINTNNWTHFVMMLTSRFTGVDDAKLIQIWQKKIAEQDQREQELLLQMLGDYKKMESKLNKSYNTVLESEDNLLKSLAQMKKI